MDKEKKSPGEDSGHREQVEINFLGFKLKCIDPTSKTIIILLLWLIFFVVIMLILPQIAIVKWFSG